MSHIRNEFCEMYYAAEFLFGIALRENEGGPNRSKASVKLRVHCWLGEGAESKCFSRRFSSKREKNVGSPSWSRAH